MQSRASLAADCLEIATRASHVARSGFGTRPAVATKSANDYVTQWDVATQELALALLAERYPGVPVAGEEDGVDRQASVMEVPLAFAVDPIDGTTNFAHGHPFWCVSIGVIAQGAPIAGAVVAPALALSWHGWVAADGSGGSVFRNGEPRRVSGTSALGDALVATGFPPVRDKAPANNFDSFMSVKRVARAVRRCGAAAIDLCFVADGTYDAYWERRLHLWDAAAGAAFVVGAGGSVTALDGASPAQLDRGHIIASNGRLHAELARAVAGVEQG